MRPPILQRRPPRASLPARATSGATEDAIPCIRQDPTLLRRACRAETVNDTSKQGERM